MIYGKLKEKFLKVIRNSGFLEDEVYIEAFPLPPEEAIGNPEERDYPLAKGRERLMQAEFRGTKGQAYTDIYGDFSGKLSEIISMELKNNFRRVILISTINAVLRHLGFIEKSIIVHCKNEELKKCTLELQKFLSDQGFRSILLVGFQPCMTEILAKSSDLKVVDMDEENIGRKKLKVIIDSPEDTKRFTDKSDIILVTVSSIANGTIKGFLDIRKPLIFHGITLVGPSKLLSLQHFCPMSH